MSDALNSLTFGYDTLQALEVPCGLVRVIP